MRAELMQGREQDWWTDKQHRFVLQCRHDDLVRRADAVNVRRAVRDCEVAGINHPQVDVQGFPELMSTPGASLGTFLAAFVSPPLSNPFAAFDVLAAIFMQAANFWLEPGIENGHPPALEE